MGSPRPANTPWLVPCLTVCDASAVITSHHNVSDFDMQDKAHNRGRPIHTEMAYQGQLTLISTPKGVFGSTAGAPASMGLECPQSFYLYCDDVDIAYQHTFDQGVTSIMAPHDISWDERYTVVYGPDGYRQGLARRSTAAWSRHHLITLPGSPQGLL